MTYQLYLKNCADPIYTAGRGCTEPICTAAGQGADGLVRSYGQLLRAGLPPLVRIYKIRWASIGRSGALKGISRLLQHAAVCKHAAIQTFALPKLGLQTQHTFVATGAGPGVDGRSEASLALTLALRCSGAYCALHGGAWPLCLSLGVDVLGIEVCPELRRRLLLGKLAC